MILETERLTLRPWKDEDAEGLFEYAKDPDVGPAAGWMPHKNVKESLSVIRNVLDGPQCYAICLKGTDAPIGSIELILNGGYAETDAYDACELGYWIAKPFWGQGLVPEAARELMRYGFNELGMSVIWCAAFGGNTKSMRVQEKIGFTFVKKVEGLKIEGIGKTVDLYVTKISKEEFMGTICGADCTNCGMKAACKGCIKTCGKPFGGTCVAAEYIKAGGKKAYEEFKEMLRQEINELLKSMDIPEALALYELAGSYVNLGYELPSGETVKFLNDKNIYLGCQIEVPDWELCCGVVADASFILVVRYGINGSDPELICYKKR